MYLFTNDESLFRSPTEDSGSRSPGLWHSTTLPLRESGSQSSRGVSQGKDQGEGSTDSQKGGSSAHDEQISSHVFAPGTFLNFSSFYS